MPTALSDGLQQRAAVQSQFALQRMLNQNPSVMAQAKLAETLSGSPVQRQDDLFEDDDVAQTKSSALQRQDMPDEADMPDEDELLQGKFQTVQRRTATGSDPSAEPIQRRENNTGLPDTLKAGIEQLSGIALDDVQVHYNSPRPAQLEALAYAQGTDIHVAPGQGQHLPHEAWQQKQGRVSPTLQTKGVAINDDPGLESEADQMGARAASGQFQPDAAPDATGQRVDLGAAHWTPVTLQALLDPLPYQMAARYEGRINAEIARRAACAVSTGADGLGGQRHDWCTTCRAAGLRRHVQLEFRTPVDYRGFRT
jgi:hypothetical protein